jgi:hypothetical protein
MAAKLKEIRAKLRQRMHDGASGTLKLAAVDSAGVLRISRYSGQLGTNEGVPQRFAANLVSNAPAAKPA